MVHGYNLDGFLPVGFQVSYLDQNKNDDSITNKETFDDNVQITFNYMGRDDKFISLHKGMDKVFAPIIENSVKLFSACTRNKITWNLFPVTGS